jgi:hypothetical protein
LAHLFITPDCFPLSVANSWVYKSDENGALTISHVSGTEVIDGTETMIFESASMTRIFYTSDTRRITIYQIFFELDGTSIEAKFDEPLLFLPNEASIGTTHISTASFRYAVFIRVNVTSISRIVGLEDVLIK